MIEGLGSQLGLSQRQLEPSSSTLYWYGNTSSSSLWYALSYIESRQTVKKGDRVWQVITLRFLSSGLHCSVVSQADLPVLLAERHCMWCCSVNESPCAAKQVCQ